MRLTFKNKMIRLSLLALIMPAASVLAGNPDRAGSAGATELLINPWAQSSGWAGANSGGVHGLEAQFLNVAGTAFTKKTEVGFTHTNYLQGSGISLNAFGLTQKVGEAGVMGVSVMSMAFGDVPITTTEQPEGNIGNYSPQFINLTFSYAKVFSNSIYGGLAIKMVSENISNIGSSGVALDAGIQYVTGTNDERNNIKFGIALKNVGSPMRFEGDGLSTRVNAPGANVPYTLTVQQRVEGFEMPSLLNIGAAYDFALATDHRLTMAANFTSNSFTSDQYMLGLEYGFRELFMLRGGFTYEENVFDDALRTTVFTGPSAGASVNLPLGKSGKRFGVDYSFRATNPWSGVHSLGAHFTL